MQCISYELYLIRKSIKDTMTNQDKITLKFLFLYLFAAISINNFRTDWAYTVFSLINKSYKVKF